MGLDPSEPIEYGINCSHWDPANETPKYLTLSFSGIQTGALWVPADDYPHNGQYLAEQLFAIPCEWQERRVGWHIALASFAAASSLYKLWGETGVLQFSSAIGTPFTWYGVNDFQGAAGNKFYGGHVQCSLTSGSLPPTISNVYDQLNISKNWETPFETFPISADEMNVRIARKIDSTNIMIRVDTSEI